MSLRKLAAMVPLAYDVRTENLVIYFSNHWDDLVDLLEAPLEFLRGQQFLWKQDPYRVGWQLLAPLTATIECGLHSPNAIVSSLALLGSDYIDVQVGDAKVFSVDLLNRVREGLAGSFFVEFATYTNSIRIVYFPPMEKDGSVMKTGRYKGGITDATLMTAEALGQTYSTLHFDLMENSHRMRAEYIVNHLEAPGDLAGRLIAEAKSDRLRGSTFRLTEARLGSTLTLPTKPLPTLNRDTTFIPGGLAGANMDAADFFEKYSLYPTMIAHNLSDPIETFVCSTITCPSVAPNTWRLGLVIVESYARMLYDPCFAIKRCRERSQG